MRRAEPSDRERVLELARCAFGGDRVAAQAGARWDWIFLHNTSSARMHYLLADAGDRLAGQYAAMPVRMQHAGKPTLGLISLDTATDPSFGRQGIFTTLAQQLYAEASREAPIVYGFPNPNSAPGFYRKLEWVELRPPPLLARPLGNLRRAVAAWRPKLVAAARLLDLASPALQFVGWMTRLVEEARGARVEDFTAFGPWADSLWRELAPSLGTCAVRDAAFLQWRFCDGPFRYRRYALHRKGEPEGFVVTTLVPWRGSTLAHIMELMVRPVDTAGARLLLAHALLDATQAGAIALLALATPRHPHRKALLQSGLFPVPRALRPQSFGVRQNGPGVVPDQLFHIEDWYVSGADLDHL